MRFKGRRQWFQLGVFAMLGFVYFTGRSNPYCLSEIKVNDGDDDTSQLAMPGDAIGGDSKPSPLLEVTLSAEIQRKYRCDVTETKVCSMGHVSSLLQDRI